MNRHEIEVLSGFVVPQYAQRNVNNRHMALTIQAELMKLGYMMSMELTEELGKCSKEFLTKFHNDTTRTIRNNIGANRDYAPLYQGFPEEVINKSEMELFENALHHYSSNGNWVPDSELVERGFEHERSVFKEFRLGTEEDFKKIFTNLVSLNQSITGKDKEKLEWFIDNYEITPDMMPENIPFKETMCILAGKKLPVPVRTVTDVMRIAVYLSGGDISLPAVPKEKTHKDVEINGVKAGQWSRSRTGYAHNGINEVDNRDDWKFRNFSRSERKYLLGLLENTNLDTREFALRQNRWVRLMEKLHPGDYAKMFPKAFKASQKVRNEKLSTWYGWVDSQFERGADEGMKALASRPGEYARRLDYLARNYGMDSAIDNFPAEKVSTKVLFELYRHFSRRNEEFYRTVKGRRSRLIELPKLEPMEKSDVDVVTNRVKEALKNHFSKKEDMGKVYIDEFLGDIPLPVDMRTANTGMKTFTRGQKIRFDMPDTNTLRVFVHWYDPHGSLDLDLSCGFFGEAGNFHISYTNLREYSTGAVHSGDIRNRRGSCAEYIDIPLKQAIDAGYTKVFVQVHNFNGGHYKNIQDCIFGWMERDKPKSNQIFEPKTVANAMRIESESSTVNLAVFDLVDKSLVWLDTEAQGGELHNIKSTSNEALKAMLTFENPVISIRDLLMWHVEARNGELVDSPDEADIVFQTEDMSYEKLADFI